MILKGSASISTNLAVSELLILFLILVFFFFFKWKSKKSEIALVVEIRAFIWQLLLDCAHVCIFQQLIFLNWELLVPANSPKLRSWSEGWRKLFCILTRCCRMSAHVGLKSGLCAAVFIFLKKFGNWMRQNSAARVKVERNCFCILTKIVWKT